MCVHAFSCVYSMSPYEIGLNVEAPLNFYWLEMDQTALLLPGGLTSCRLQGGTVTGA